MLAGLMEVTVPCVVSEVVETRHEEFKIGLGIPVGNRD